MSARKRLEALELRLAELEAQVKWLNMEAAAQESLALHAAAERAAKPPVIS